MPNPGDCVVITDTPSTPGLDWNDVLRAASSIGARSRGARAPREPSPSGSDAHPHVMVTAVALIARVNYLSTSGEGLSNQILDVQMRMQADCLE